MTSCLFLLWTAQNIASYLFSLKLPLIKKIGTHMGGRYDFDIGAMGGSGPSGEFSERTENLSLSGESVALNLNRKLCVINFYRVKSRLLEIIH